MRHDVGSARGAGRLLGYTLAIPPTWPMRCANRRSGRLGTQGSARCELAERMFIAVRHSVIGVRGAQISYD